MIETIRKRWYKSRATIFLILVSSVFITSCNGQDSKNLGETKAVQSDTSPTEPSTRGNQADKQTFVDPLFYIDGQLCQHVRKIFQDKNGNLWFGTNVYGLMRYNGNELEYFSEKDGLGGGRITGIVEDRAGNVWFGTYGGLTKYDGNSFTNFKIQEGPFNNDIWSLIIDSKDQFWIGTTEGVMLFDGEKFTSFPIPKAEVEDTTTVYSYNRVTCILEDKDGTLWFGTDGFGMCKYDRSTFSVITKEDGLPDNNIYDMMEDSRGNIWIGTMFGGVSRFDGNTFTNYTEDGVIDGIEVGGLYEDKAGNIWFAAENFGVYRFDPQLNNEGNQEAAFTNFHSKKGLNTNGILSIFEDVEGRFWFGGWGGLFRYDPLASLKSDEKTLPAPRKSFYSVTENGPWN